MDPRITRAAADIRAMRVRGAAEIGRHAASALAVQALRHGGPEARLRRDLHASGRHLLRARPTAVSLANAIGFVLRGLADADPARAVARRAQEFTHRSLAARDRAAANAAARLRGPLVLTICNSQAAVGAIVEARRTGRAQRAVAFETRPWRQGLLTARQLRDHRVPVTLAVDSAAASLVLEADSCVVGADTLVGNGDVVNKIGTRMLALLAHDAGIPFVVCAESFKAHPTAERGADVRIERRPPAEILEGRRLPGVRVHNAVFDVTEARLVTHVATELGASRPDVAVRKARRAWR